MSDAAKSWSAHLYVKLPSLRFMNMISCAFPLSGFDLHPAQSLTPWPVLTGHADPTFITCFFSCLSAAKL